MRKVLVKGRELKDVDVDFISSVGRPASRVPFGIMKSEDNADQDQGATSMFDLFIKKNDAAPKASSVVAVILKADPSEAVSNALTALGLKVDEKQDVDGVTLLVQDASIAKEDTAIVKISDNLAVSVPMLKMDGDFAAACAQRGFYPSISIATDLLQEELYKSVSKAKDGSDAAEMITKATADFGTYMSRLVSSLPQTIFKMDADAALRDAFVVKSDPAQVIETATQIAADASTDTVVEKNDEPTAEQITEIEKSAGKAWKDMTDEEKAEAKKKKAPVEKQDAPAFDMAAMAELITKSVNDKIAPQLASVSEKVDALGTRVEQVEQVAKSADESVRGTVLGNVFEDRQNRDDVEKSEYQPLLDTAYAR